jgi:hypothetical protein
MAVVGLSAVGVEDKSAAPSHMARRASALCVLFFILAIVADGSPGRRKAANGLGLLVTVGYLATERNAFTALGTYFAGAKTGGDKSSAGGAGLQEAAGG